MMHFVTDHLLDAIFCFIILHYGYKVLHRGDFMKLEPAIRAGIKVMMISAMCVVGLTSVSWMHHSYLEVANFISNVGVYFGLCLAMYGHRNMPQ